MRKESYGWRMQRASYGMIGENKESIQRDERGECDRGIIEAKKQGHERRL